jgi:hypothetical protein
MSSGRLPDAETPSGGRCGAREGLRRPEDGGIAAARSLTLEPPRGLHALRWVPRGSAEARPRAAPAPRGNDGSRHGHSACALPHAALERGTQIGSILAACCSCRRVGSDAEQGRARARAGARDCWLGLENLQQLQHVSGAPGVGMRQSDTRSDAGQSFERFPLAPGGARQISFEIGPDDLELWGMSMQRTVEPGEYVLEVGSSSAELTSAKLEVRAR